jgi:predicted small lipoprotein YifL
MRQFIFGFALFSLLTACGQKGDLYLPGTEPKTGPEKYDPSIN